MGILQRFKDYHSGGDVGPEAEKIKALTDQFHLTLKTLLAKREQSKVPATSATILARVQSLLAKDDLVDDHETSAADAWNWKDASPGLNCSYYEHNSTGTSCSTACMPSVV